MSRPRKFVPDNIQETPEIDIETLDREIEIARASDALLNALYIHHPNYKPNDVRIKKPDKKSEATKNKKRKS